LGVDEVEDRLALARQAHAPHGDGDDLGARLLVRLSHDLVARILAGPHDEPRREVLAAQDEIGVVHLYLPPIISALVSTRATPLPATAPPRSVPFPPCPHRSPLQTHTGPGPHCRVSPPPP